MTKVWKEHNTQKDTSYAFKINENITFKELKRMAYEKTSLWGSWIFEVNRPIVGGSWHFSKILKSEGRFVKRKFGCIKQKIGSTYIKKIYIYLRTIAKRRVKYLHKNVAFACFAAANNAVKYFYKTKTNRHYTLLYIASYWHCICVFA